MTGERLLDEFGQHTHGTNFPQPIFIRTGPTYVRILTADELMHELVDRYREEGDVVAPHSRLHLKMPGDPEIRPVMPEVIDVDDDCDPAIGLRCGDDFTEFLHIGGHKLVLGPA